MRFLERIKEKSLAKREVDEREIAVSVPDIKAYLVKEYEKVNELKLINQSLEQQIEEARETKLKYDAAMVTLDEYDKRLRQAESEIERWKISYQNAKESLAAERDKVNSYAIKFNNAAITKKEIAEEITEEIKAELISLLNEQKGNLSKKTVCEIISAYKRSES